MSSSPSATFDNLEKRLASDGAEAVFDDLSAELKQEKKLHELFDVLLMRSRHKLGLPVTLSTPIDDLDEPLRSQLEEAYLASCREVGSLLLDEGKLREAWMYLRPVGDKKLVAGALQKIEANEENLQDLIEIGLHEGVSPALGYELVLSHYGTCNAITTFEGAVLARPKAEQQVCAAMLLRHLHAELMANVKADIARQEGNPPQEQTLREQVADRDWLFAENNYHTDTTHLAATVRFARLLEDAELIALALDLTEYGRRLSSQFQFAGEEPFVDVYPSHGLFFAAQLGRQVDEALAYFEKRAREVNLHEYGSGPAEVFVTLLARLKRYDEAIAASIELLPPGTRTSGFAPTMLELSRLAGDYRRMMEVCRERGDLVSFAAGLLAAKSQKN
ncbi:MAG: hypothetical protein DWQ37_21250 [Planctomycetota bacterium]|nr:MAG: hypothetical protein DWQ37_21250 [Planctomycetota bacterium]